MSKKKEADEWRAKELERRRRLVLSKYRKAEKLAAILKVLCKRKFKSQRAKNNQFTRIYVLMVRIRVIQGEVLMVISQPLNKFPPGTEMHPNYGEEIIHDNLDEKQIIPADGRLIPIKDGQFLFPPSERIFPKFDNLGKTDEGVY